MESDVPGFRLYLFSWGGNPFGGIAVGLTPQALFAPASEWAQGLGLFALPLVFGLGMKLCYARVVAAGTASLFGAFKPVLLRGQDFREATKAQFADLRGRPLSGTGVFFPVALLIGCFAGLTAAVMPSAIGLCPVVTIWIAVAGGYGLLLRWLAPNGYLPLPDDA